MANPWTKKNPFLSMFLSGANSAAGKTRGLWMQQARRNQTAAAMSKTGTPMRLPWAEERFGGAAFWTLAGGHSVAAGAAT